ncbi:unnamed protein product [Aphanomyces euteiches]|nr:hypothetical protein AeRB84_001878 [Aphanomyces euteiches]
MDSTCFFKDCPNPVAAPGKLKCTFHAKKGICGAPDCHNQVYARGHCIRHGGRRPCRFEGCSGNARSRGYCTRHSSSTNAEDDALALPDFDFDIDMNLVFDDVELEQNIIDALLVDSDFQAVTSV